MSPGREEDDAAKPAGGARSILAGLRRADVGARVARVRANVWLALQTGLAAALAWYTAHEIVGHPAPFFAPIAAVVTLGASVGQRLRRAVELVVGVAVGIAVGDLLVALLGTGVWQLGLLVTLAITVAIFLGTGPALIVQGGASAVLVATLAPASQGVTLDRLVDALVGGGVGLAVMAVLLPINPLTIVQRAATPILDVLAEGLNRTADGLAARDKGEIDAALARMREGEAELREFTDALAAGKENATLAPARWRSRDALAQYVDSAEYLSRALRSARVLVRRAAVLLDDGEPVPEALVRAVRGLGEAFDWLRREFADAKPPEAARGRALEAVRAAADAYTEGVQFSGSVVVAQVRSTANDVLRASGLAADETQQLVRRAFKKGSHGAR